MASGDTLVVFTALHNEPPATAFATLDVRAGGSTPAEQLVVLDFDADTDETAEFGGFMPRVYGAGGITVTIGWMATTATTGNCIWDVSFKSVSDDADDMDTKAFAAVNSVTDAAASASGEVAYATVTFTDGADMDSVAAGEYFRMRVTRDANNASDTMSGDAELVFVEIKET